MICTRDMALELRFGVDLGDLIYTCSETWDLRGSELEIRGSSLPFPRMRLCVRSRGVGKPC